MGAGSRNTSPNNFYLPGYWTTPIEMSEPPEEPKWSPPSSWRGTSWRRRWAALPRHNRRLPWSPALHKPFVLFLVVCLVILAETSGCNCTHISQEDSPIVTCVLWEAPSVKRTQCFPFSSTKPQFLLWSNNATFLMLLDFLKKGQLDIAVPWNYLMKCGTYLLQRLGQLDIPDIIITYRNTWWQGFTVIFITYSVLVTDSSNIYVAPFSKNTIQIFRNKVFYSDSHTHAVEEV